MVEYIKRDIDEEIKELAEHYPVVTIMGPRQSGKTTLSRHAFADKPYINLEYPDNRAMVSEDPRRFLREHKDGAIIDEIQYFPELTSYIQGDVDENSKPGKYILTGSQNFALTQSVSQSLAGRTGVLTLLPLTISELSGQVDKTDLDNLLYSGFYPRLYQTGISPTTLYRDYVQTYIERDVRNIKDIKDLSLFTKFIRICASRIGQIFNYSSVSNELGVDEKTVKQWLSVLEASYIIYVLRPYHKNIGKRLIKSSKIYFTDTGLAAFLLNIYSKENIIRDSMRGMLFENLVVMEAVKTLLNSGKPSDLYFYRDSNGLEVDLLLPIAGQMVPIEIKSSETFNTKFLKGVKFFQGLMGQGRGYVIYSGPNNTSISDISIRHFSKTREIILSELGNECNL